MPLQIFYKMKSYHRSLSLVEAPDPYRYVQPEGQKQVAPKALADVDSPENESKQR